MYICIYLYRYIYQISAQASAATANCKTSIWHMCTGHILRAYHSTCKYALLEHAEYTQIFLREYNIKINGISNPPFLHEQYP